MAAFIQSPPSVGFWDLWGEWFSSANKLLFVIEFLHRSTQSVVIKQLKMTQSAGGPASGKLLSISCQQWPLGLPSHGTGKQGIISSWAWLRDHTGPIVSSSLRSYCSSASGKGRAFTSVVCGRIGFLQAKAMKTVRDESRGTQRGYGVDLE